MKENISFYHSLRALYLLESRFIQWMILLTFPHLIYLHSLPNVSFLFLHSTHTHRTLDFSWTIVAREYADIHWIEFQLFCFCCESPRVQLLFICISVCLSVCLCMHIPSLCDRKPITSYGNVFFFARTFRQSFQSIRMCRLCVLCRITSQSVQKQHRISHLQTNLFLFGVFGTQ